MKSKEIKILGRTGDYSINATIKGACAPNLDSQVAVIRALPDTVKYYFPKGIRIDYSKAEDLLPETKAGIESIQEVHDRICGHFSNRLRMFRKSVDKLAEKIFDFNEEN